MRLGGFFRAPVGLYLAGYGALCAALAFPLDDAWHRLHGVDVTIWAPFHVMIVAGMAMAAVGTAYTLAPWSRAGGALGLATVAAVLLVLLAQALDRQGLLLLRPRPVVLFPPLLVALTLPWLVAAAVALPPRLPRPASRPARRFAVSPPPPPPARRLPLGGATLAALALTLLRLALLLFVPWAVRVTAQAEGLPFRPGAPSVDRHPPGLPLLGAARRGPARRRAVALPLPALVAPGAARAAADGDGGGGAAGPARPPLGADPAPHPRRAGPGRGGGAGHVAAGGGPLCPARSGAGGRGGGGAAPGAGVSQAVVPLWLGWVVGLTPALALLGFLLAQVWGAWRAGALTLDLPIRTEPAPPPGQPASRPGPCAAPYTYIR